MSKRDTNSNSNPNPNRNTYFNTKSYSDTEASPKPTVSPNAATLVRLTEKVACLGFAPVRVVDQRDSQAKYFPWNWSRFSFAINYSLSAINSLRCWL
jgi:hypothetical protein